MILYVNGDSHTAAAEAVNPYGWACDDGRYFYMGQAAHPDNLAVSWGKQLADTLKMGLFCHAQAGGSNPRIIRTTREFIQNQMADRHNYFFIIQWSTWERDEWLINDDWVQINASGQDSVPASHVEKYKQFIADIDWKQCAQKWHNEIWQFHLELEEQQIPHVFFNGDNHFGVIPETDRRQWGNWYIDPYSSKTTFSGWLKRNGHDTVAPNSWHFGKSAHSAWSRFMLQYIIKNKLLP